MLGFQRQQQGHGAARRVQCTRDLHPGNGPTHGDCRQQPAQGLLRPPAHHQQGPQRRHRVAHHTGPGLGQRAGVHRKHQHRRRTQRRKQCPAALPARPQRQLHQGRRQHQAQARSQANPQHIQPCGWGHGRLPSISQLHRVPDEETRCKSGCISPRPQHATQRVAAWPAGVCAGVQAKDSAGPKNSQRACASGTPARCSTCLARRMKPTGPR